VDVLIACETNVGALGTKVYALDCISNFSSRASHGHGILKDDTLRLIRQSIYWRSDLLIQALCTRSAIIGALPRGQSR